MRSPTRAAAPPRADHAPPTEVTVVASRRVRRRFARRQWARRWLAWRRVLVVVLLGGLLGLGVYAVWFSSWLAVTGVRVAGTELLAPADVRAVARVPEGRSLARVDLDAVESRVRSLAAVREVDVSRQWPDQVLVTVEERVAVAVVEIGGQVRGMDADGVVFRDYSRAPEELPRVQVASGATSDALREGALVVSALPETLRLLVDHVEVETVDQISLVLEDGRVVRWGSAEDSELKAEVLVPLLRQPGRVLDVSVPGQVTTSPGS